MRHNATVPQLKVGLLADELQDIHGNRADVRIGRVGRKIDLELRFRLAELQRLLGREQAR